MIFFLAFIILAAPLVFTHNETLPDGTQIRMYYDEEIQHEEWAESNEESPKIKKGKICDPLSDLMEKDKKYKCKSVKYHKDKKDD